jgi:hypothetical protein
MGWVLEMKQTRKPTGYDTKTRKSGALEKTPKKNKRKSAGDGKRGFAWYHGFMTDVENKTGAGRP